MGWGWGGGGWGGGGAWLQMNGALKHALKHGLIQNELLLFVDFIDV